MYVTFLPAHAPVVCATIMYECAVVRRVTVIMLGSVSSCAWYLATTATTKHRAQARHAESE